MQDKILELMKSDNKAYELNTLAEFLDINSVDELKELMKTLKDMEDNLLVERTKKDKYMLFSNELMKIGKIDINKKGFAFVTVDGMKDVYVNQKHFNGAINGDMVLVEVTPNKTEKPEGKVIKIVKREQNPYVGEYVSVDDNNAYVVLDDPKYTFKVMVDPRLSLGAVNGHKVLIKLGGVINNEAYKGQVVKILGHKNAPGVDILSVMAKYDIDAEFPEDVVEQVANIPTFVSDEEKQGREDLTNELIVTIDGDDTKDIDDAISIKKLENNNYLLGVHIADVSHYVKEGTPLDKEALKRGNSNYLADKVVPMLLQALSNGICSLNPNVDRLAFSTMMEINDKGEIADYNFYESVIKSSKQMTYKNFNKVVAGETPDDYKEYENMINMMVEVAEKLRKRRVKEGYNDFDKDEAKIIIDEKTGEVVDIVKRERGVGERVIENFMIANNEAVGTYFSNLDIPTLYRVHGTPDEKKTEELLKFYKTLGVTIDQKYNFNYPKSMQQLLELAGQYDFAPILRTQALRSMRKAEYSPDNVGHYSLALKDYVHFTAPIRRYSDIVVHRGLKKLIKNDYLSETAIQNEYSKLASVGEHVSQTERNSIECEREVDDMKKAEYMMKHIGEEYEGMIDGVAPYGFFVELDNLVEGLVRIDSLTQNKKENFFYDEASYSIRNENNSKRYRIGDRIIVVVKNASKELKQIDFEVKDNNIEMMR